MKEFGFAKMTTAHLALVKANIVSLYQAGAFFGALLAYASAYYLGRKRSLTLWSCVFVVGAALTCGSRGDQGLGLVRSQV